jgi:rhodanese-related sulfurtransferase
MTSISVSGLRGSSRGDDPPLIIDVRRSERWREAPDQIRGALRRDPARVEDWARTLPRAGRVVVYCVHGHEVSQGAARALIAHGIAAAFLEGGIETWKREGQPTTAKPVDAATRWVTRERPKIDRIACPWLVRRFVDADAEFLYVPPGEVLRTARECRAVPYDVPEVEFSHEGDLCSFDAFLRIFHLQDPALQELARIVRGADTGRPELSPQSAGLLAVSLGLSRNFADDHEMLKYGMVIYDALYRWCKEGKLEAHTWKPEAYRA